YILTGNTKDREWAWKRRRYLGGRTKNGEYTQANRLATDAMLGSGYQSVMDSELLRKGWSKWGDVPTILSAWKGATNFAEVVPTVSQPWYPRWSDMMNVELTACLQGKVTADQACDNMVAAVALAIALVINDERVWLSRVTRGLLLVPWGVPPVVNGLLWSFIFNAQYGYLNRALLALGLIAEHVNWLGDSRLAMGAVITAYVWR